MEGSAAGMKDRARDRDRWGDIYANMPVKKMIAMYDYDPQELSPNVDAEVSTNYKFFLCLVWYLGSSFSLYGNIELASKDARGSTVYSSTTCRTGELQSVFIVSRQV